MSGTIFVCLVASTVASEASRGHILPPGKSDPFRVLRVLKYSGSDRVKDLLDARGQKETVQGSTLVLLMSVCLFGPANYLRP